MIGVQVRTGKYRLGIGGAQAVGMIGVQVRTGKYR